MPRTHKDLIKPKPFHLPIPGMSLEHAIKPLAHVPERAQVFPVDDDQLGTRFLSGRYLRELGNAAGTSDVVACRQNTLLPNAQRKGLECGVLIFKDGGVEAVVVLASRVSSAQLWPSSQE